MERLKSGSGLDWKFAAYVVRGDDEVISGIDASISWIEGKVFNETSSQLKVFDDFDAWHHVMWRMKFQLIFFFPLPDFEEWWDDSEEAGPKTRTKTDFNDPKAVFGDLVSERWETQDSWPSIKC